MGYEVYVGLLIFVVVFVIFIVIIMWIMGTLLPSSARPGFSASLDANLTPAADTYTQLTGFTTLNDPYAYNGNSDLDLTTGEFTVSKTGWYHVTLNVMSDTTTGQLNAKIVHTRGVTVTDVLENNSTSGVTDTSLYSAHLSGDMYLLSGDVLHTEVYLDDGDVLGDVRTNFSALYV